MYKVIASNGSRIQKENLDSVIELQEFAERMQLKGYLNLVVEHTRLSGYVTVFSFIFNGQTWDRLISNKL